jgi:enamine deaminase RidA (YjgF/YER057c/UK114 family)
MFARTNPDVGYLKGEVFDAFSFSQVVRTGDTIHLSGITPLRGGLTDLELVGDDVRTQLEWVLEVLRRCRESEGLSVENLAAVTVYTTAMAELVDAAELFKKAFGEHPPAATWIQVQGLFHPQQKVEITAIASAA